MLTDRMAAVIVGHEPGWRLPQPSVLARRFNVTIAETERALTELIRRRLVRQLPDGRLQRASPAECLIALEGMPGLGASIDPMGAAISCTSRHVSWRRLPEDVALVLGILPAAEASVIRCQWAADGSRAGLSTTYLTGQPHLPGGADACRLQDELSREPLAVLDAAGGLVPVAVHVEVQAPPASVARRLGLAPGEPAIAVTVRFHDPSGRWPAGLTAVVLRADLFRIVLHTAAGPGSPSPAAQGPPGLAYHMAEPDQ